MAIYRGSRYEGVGYIGIEKNGITKKFLDSRVPLSKDDFITGNNKIHRARAGEMLDFLAYLYYKDERLWWLIAEVNDIYFMHDVYAGQELFIPDKTNLHVSRES
jgi:hypothetical protein